MISIKEVFRLSTKKGRHQGCLFLRIISNRTCRTVTIPNSGLYPEEWDKERLRIIYPIDNPRRREQLKLLEKYIDKEKSALLRIVRNLEEQGIYFDADDVADSYRRYLNSGNCLLAYSQKLIRQMQAKECERMAVAYKVCVARLIGYNHGRDIPLNKMTAGLMKGFEQYLLSEGLKSNSIAFYMRNLRSIYNKAVAERYIELAGLENPFVDVITTTQRTVKRALTAKDMQKILNCDLLDMKSEYHRKYLYEAQSIFLFSFYMRGMSFVDVAYLRKENIVDGFIRYRRRKTNTLIEVKMTPELQKIINIFADEVSNSPYVFPLIKPEVPIRPRLQYMNALRMQNVHLTTLAKIAGVDKKVTTHVARHSWASIGKQQRVPLSVLSECLGHSSERMTSIYLSSFESTVLDSANNLVAKAIK